VTSCAGKTNAYNSLTVEAYVGGVIVVLHYSISMVWDWCLF
jgi:hypothetical protein